MFSASLSIILLSAGERIRGGHRGGCGSPPLVPPGGDRGGGPEPALSGLHLPQGHRDLHEPVLLAISHRLHRHPDLQVTRL